MTEQEWFDCTELQTMLEWLKGRAGNRKMRLFGCACCRRAWHLLTDDRSRAAVEACEAFADGRIDQAALRRAHQAAHDAVEANVETWLDENLTPFDAVRTNAEEEAYEAADLAADTLRNSVFADRREEEEREQIALLRDIFGNPFRSLKRPSDGPFLPDGSIDRIARTIYERSAFDLLPILGDALEEAGVTDTEILHHCRQSGKHVRGCWVVDLILGNS